MSTLYCYGLRDGKPCEATSLCKAHIIPRAFARHVRRDKEIILVSTGEGICKPAAQDGVFDPNILCSHCDKFLGKFDKYAIEFCRSFNAKAIRHGAGWEIANVDGERLAKFFLAVLWRASISSRPEFLTTKLGPYEKKARDVLFGSQSLASITSFTVSLARLETKAAKRRRSLYPTNAATKPLGLQWLRIRLGRVLRIGEDRSALLSIINE